MIFINFSNISSYEKIYLSRTGGRRAMSLSTKDIHAGAVASISDTDLVMVSAPGGGYQPIPFSDLMARIKGNIQIGGRNLIKNSGASISNTLYQTAAYQLACNLSIGETLLVTIWGELGAGRTNFVVFNGGMGNGSYGGVVLSKIRDGLYQGKLQILKLSDDGYISVYAAPASSTSINTINHIKLERGNIATDWCPAPEDIASGAWGGVNQRFTISYNLPSDKCEKGGTHDTDQRAYRSINLIVSPRGVYNRGCKSVVSRNAYRARVCVESRQSYAHGDIYSSRNDQRNIPIFLFIPLRETDSVGRTERGFISDYNLCGRKYGKPNRLEQRLGRVANAILNDLARKEVAL